VPERRPGRRIVGITGAPGAGKSTYAAEYAGSLGVPSAYVPMDGFHLADATLVRLGLLDRKGAPETFDAWGYAALLHCARPSRTPSTRPASSATWSRPWPEPSPSPRRPRWW
jgi:pantothenate kinase